MDRLKFEIRIFHLFNGIAWFVAFILFFVTQQAKPQDIDMFNYGIEDQISRNWNDELLVMGKWVLLSLCVICTIGLISNIVMGIDTEKKFSISQVIVTLITIGFTLFYFVRLGL
ncbi:MAG: hypothetical protein N4A76_17370 [Firmicutes bacterium]|jgi:hypothetical protein|nr:hypothetical protein [Bacillota bacterium]